MKYAPILPLLFPVFAPAATPFLIFSSDAAYKDAATIPLAEKYLLPQDYLGYEAAEAVPQLGSLFSAAHRVALAPTVEAVRQFAQQGCASGRPGVIYYNITENAPGSSVGWTKVLQDISSASAAIPAGGCQSFGLIPERALFTSGGCDGQLDGPLYAQIDWSRIGYLDLRLARSDCTDASSIESDAKLAKSIADYVRARNPKIVLTGHLSFGTMNPEVIASVANALNGIVDGFLIAYPMSPMHQRLYCTALNLETLFSALRPH